MSEIEELADSFYRQFMIYRKKLLLTPPNVCKKLLNLMICESILNSPLCFRKLPERPDDSSICSFSKIFILARWAITYCLQRFWSYILMFITRPKSEIGQNKFGNECLKIEGLADSFYRQFMIYRKKLLLTPPQCVLEIAQFDDL